MKKDSQITDCLDLVLVVRNFVHDIAEWYDIHSYEEFENEHIRNMAKAIRYFGNNDPETII